MTEEMNSGEVKAIPIPYEENARKYADKQAELYRGLKEPSGGYANIVDAYIAGATKETKELEKQISILLSCKDCSENKGGLICEKEYNDKCLSQKIQYIKELQEENKQAKEIIREFITWGDGLDEYDPENPEEYTKAWHKLFDRIKAFVKE